MASNSEFSFNLNYKENKELFGHPYIELQDFFKKYPNKGTVLDLGCGQGRDSLFLASIEYKVVAVDNSEVGIKQMLDKAKEMDIKLEAFTADILEFQCHSKFDIILFDMLLHSFTESQQLEILEKYFSILNKDGIMCIVYPDDMSEKHFMDILNSLNCDWKILDRRDIKDVPTLENEKADYEFKMLVVQKSKN